MNQLEDDGERMVELGHPAVGPIQVRRPRQPLLPQGPLLPPPGGLPGRPHRGRWKAGPAEGAVAGGMDQGRDQDRAWSEGSLLLSPGPPGGPKDGMAELPEPVYLPGEPAAAR